MERGRKKRGRAIREEQSRIIRLSNRYSHAEDCSACEFVPGDWSCNDCRNQPQAMKEEEASFIARWNRIHGFIR